MAISKKTQDALKALGFKPGGTLYPEPSLENYPFAVSINKGDEVTGRCLCRMKWLTADPSPGSEDAKIVKKFRALLKAGEAQGGYSRFEAGAFLTEERLVEVCRKAVKLAYCPRGGQTFAEITRLMERMSR